MVFLEPQQTPYDLRFRLVDIPVRIHPMFWLLSAVLGWSAVQYGIQFVVLWIGCVFVSILIHELGLVWMGQAFGTRGHIVLYSFGGLAIGSNALSQWWKRVLVSLAGPFAGFAFLALVFVVVRFAMPSQFDLYIASLKVFFLGPQSLNPTEMKQLPEIATLFQVPTLQWMTFLFLFQINLFWGFLNLLPIWPLDGGQVSRDILGHLIPQQGFQIALVISLVVAGSLAINAVLGETQNRTFIPFAPRGFYIAIMFGLLAFQSFQLLQQRSHDPHDPWMGQGRPWERRR